MALRPLQAGKEPLGQFDGYDADFLTIRGGEIGTFTNVPYAFPPGASVDHATFDVFDGYSGYPANTRTVVTHTLTTGDRPLFLLDEGTVGYGMLVGVLVGGMAGQMVSNPSNPTRANGTVLGPHSAYASGKVTLWDKPGLYAVTLDAVEHDLAPTTLLVPGQPLYATSAGRLTSDDAVRFDTIIIARFVEFSTNGSLVTTPNWLVAGTRTFTQVVIHFHPGL